MKVTGLDRIVIMVKDMDRALEFFSGKLGMEFKELDKEISERDGVRSYVCHETHLHLIAPILPLSENAPPPMKRRAALLEKQPFVFMALTFMVDDPTQAAADLERQGIRIQPHRYEASHDYASIGMDSFAEVMTFADETFGLVMGFAKYDRV